MDGSVKVFQRRKIAWALFAVFVLLALLATTVYAAPSARQANLTGSAEVPGPGDPDGVGRARITLDRDLGQVCWELRGFNITLPATGAHIHSGEAGVSGPIVVTLSPPDESGTSSGCVAADISLITDIRNNPSAYYVNIHTSDFPSGAIRGQLER